MLSTCTFTTPDDWLSICTRVFYGLSTIRVAGLKLWFGLFKHCTCVPMCQYS